MSSSGSVMCDRLLQSLSQVQNRAPGNFSPRLGLVLGSGWGEFVEELTISAVIPFADLPGFPASTVIGHAGCLVLGFLDDVPLAVFQGRLHYYEGYDMADVVMPIRLLCLLGVEAVVLTNAAGGITTAMTPGSLMLVTDHISCLVPSPLRGENLDELGPRFPDMSEVYDRQLRQLARQAAKAEQINLQEGIYIQTAGPNFETPAEISMYGHLGADAVGMSTACEAVAARHCGLRVCAIAGISNLAAGISSNKLSVEEVYETSRRSAPTFRRLLRRLLREIAAAPTNITTL